MVEKQASPRNFRMENLLGEINTRPSFALPYASKLVAILEGHGIKSPFETKHEGHRCDELYLAGMERGEVSKEHLVNAVGRILGFPNNPLQNKAYAFFIAEGYDELMKLSVQELEEIPARMLIFRANKRHWGRHSGITNYSHGRKLKTEIRVFCSSNADPKTVAESIEGLERLVDYLGLNLKISHMGVHDETSRILNGKREMNFETFIGIINSVAESHGTDAFNVVIAGTPFSGLVDGMQLDPTTVLCPRFNPARKIVQHEMMHNLEVTEHTVEGLVRVGSSEWDKYLQDPNYSNSALGYPEDENCLMVSYLPRSENLCGKCRDSFHYYWKGVEDTLHK